MKIFFHLSSLFFILISMVSVTFADPSNCTTSESDVSVFLWGCAGGTSGVDPLDTQDGKEGVRERVVVIAEGAIGLGAVFAIGFLVWAGIQYTTAYGDDEKLKHAKSTGTYALGGLLLLMLAFGLVDIFLRFIYRDFS